MNCPAGIYKQIFTILDNFFTPITGIVPTLSIFIALKRNPTSYFGLYCYIMQWGMNIRENRPKKEMESSEMLHKGFVQANS